MLGYRPLDKRWKVEVSDETGFCKAYDTMKEAVKDFERSNSSCINYATANDRPFVKSRSDKKKFWA